MMSYDETLEYLEYEDYLRDRKDYWRQIEEE